MLLAAADGRLFYAAGDVLELVGWIDFSVMVRSLGAVVCRWGLPSVLFFYAGHQMRVSGRMERVSSSVLS